MGVCSRYHAEVLAMSGIVHKYSSTGTKKPRNHTGRKGEFSVAGGKALRRSLKKLEARRAVWDSKNGKRPGSMK